MLNHLPNILTVNLKQSIGMNNLVNGVCIGIDWEEVGEEMFIEKR